MHINFGALTREQTQEIARQAIVELPLDLVEKALRDALKDDDLYELAARLEEPVADGD